MKENLHREFLDLRRFENPISSIDLIKSITSNQNIENDPFYIVDLEDICNKHINWITRLPRVEPHYAVKCNTDPMLLKLLAFLGAGFDCASKGEIAKVLELGVASHRIIYANPCKQASYIRYAYKQGVEYMTFDNELELHKIKENHPTAKCVLRIITNDANAVCRFSMKFGADMETSVKLIDTAVRLGLDLVGVSFHVGSGQMSPEAFSESIANARQLFDYAREQFGVRMHLLDLGGGYPGNSDAGQLFNSIAKEINRALEMHFSAAEFAQLNGVDDENKLRIIAEPGRYYAASAFTLCVNIIAKRVVGQNKAQQAADKETHPENVIVNETNGSRLFTRDQIDSSQSIMYYINDGVYASFNCLFYDHAEVVPILIEEKNKKSGGEIEDGSLVEENNNDRSLFKSSIWGPTCDGLDLVVKECYLPDMREGEFMIFKNMGAYTISGAVPFNGIPLARCIYIASTSWNTIKEAFNEPLESANDLDLINSISSPLLSVANTCAAAASMTFTRAMHQQQQQNELDLLHMSLDSHQVNGQTDETINEEANSTNGNAVIDCGITC